MYSWHITICRYGYGFLYICIYTCYCIWLHTLKKIYIIRAISGTGMTWHADVGIQTPVRQICLWRSQWQEQDQNLGLLTHTPAILHYSHLRSHSICLCGSISKGANWFRSLQHYHVEKRRSRDWSYWETHVNYHTVAMLSPSLFLIKGPADTLRSSLGGIPSTKSSPICPWISSSCLSHWHSHPPHQTVFIYSPWPSPGNDVRH